MEEVCCIREIMLHDVRELWVAGPGPHCSSSRSVRQAITATIAELGNGFRQIHTHPLF